jgi:DNA-binding beta-propeller fold protein YncE
MRALSLLTAGVSLAAAFTLLPAGAAAQQYKVERFNIGGEGGFDYLAVDSTSGRVYVSRGTHVMVVDGPSGNVINDLKDTPRVHGIAFAPKWNHGFTTNGGDSTSTMFDMKTMAVIKKIKAGKDGLDGIMYDDATDKILTLNHSKPMGSAVVIDAKSGDVVTTIPLNGTGPEGGVSNGKDRIYVNLEDKNAIDVINTKTWKVIATWSISPCDGPTGIAMDRATNRIFSGCGKSSVVIDAATGTVVGQIANGEGVDAMGWDQSQKMLYIPAGGSGNITIAHEDSPNKITILETIPTMKGARTIAVDNTKHIAYQFTLEYGPSTAPAVAGGRPTRGPVLGAWFIVVKR